MRSPPHPTRAMMRGVVQATALLFSSFQALAGSYSSHPRPQWASTHYQCLPHPHEYWCPPPPPHPTPLMRRWDEMGACYISFFFFRADVGSELQLVCNCQTAYSLEFVMQIGNIYFRFFLYLYFCCPAKCKNRFNHTHAFRRPSTCMYTCTEYEKF